MTRPKSLAAALLVAVAALFILSQAKGFGADKDLLSNGGFSDDLSSWETTINAGFEVNGEIVHDRQYYGLREGSLKAEAISAPGKRFAASATQKIEGLKKGSKVRLSLWWRKLVLADGRGAKADISVWLKGEGAAPLLLWTDKTLPPIPGTAMSSRVNGLETSRPLVDSGPYDLVVQFTLKTGQTYNSRALVQVDDLSLEEVEEPPMVIRQTTLPSQTVKAGAGGVKAMAFSLKSVAGNDVVSSITLREGAGETRSFARVHLFHDTEPFGRLDAKDQEVAGAVSQDGTFTLETLTLPLGKEALHLLVTVDTTENAPDGLSQSLVLEQVQGLFRRTKVKPRFGARITVDAKAPATATGFLVMPGAMPFVVWKNPPDPDFARFRLVRKKNATPSGPFDPRAAVIVEAKRPAGTIGTFIDRKPGRGKFFYAVYTADRLGNYQTATVLGVNAGFVEVRRQKPLF